MTEEKIKELFAKWLKYWQGMTASALTSSEEATAEAAFTDALHKGFQLGLAAKQENPAHE